MPEDCGSATLIMQRGEAQPRPARRRWHRVARELSLLAVFAGIYEWIGAHLVQAGGAAASHALMIVAAERGVGLFHEQDVQQAFIHSDTITDAFNAYYGGTHFLVPAFVLGWLLFRHPGQYRRARTALAVLTGVAFVCFWLFPVAPPRLLPARFGILDMLTVPDGSGHFETSLINTAGDRYASMPSLHVAWAVWCALALWPVVRPRLLRVLVVAYPLMTVLVVVATGNHYFLDAVAGALLSVISWIAVTWIGTWLSVRRGTRALARQQAKSGLSGLGSHDGVDVGGELVGGSASGGRGHPCVSLVTALRRHCGQRLQHGQLRCGQDGAGTVAQGGEQRAAGHHPPDPVRPDRPAHRPGPSGLDGDGGQQRRLPDPGLAADDQPATLPGPVHPADQPERRGHLIRPAAQHRLAHCFLPG